MDANLQELLRTAVDLLPEDLRNRVIVFGSAPMVLAGLRERASDLDLFVSEPTFDALSTRGFTVRESKPGVPSIQLAQRIDVFKTWQGVEFPDVLMGARREKQALGLHVASLESVLQSKIASGRAKDEVDIRILRAHLSRRD